MNTEILHNKTEKHLVPQLRFDEFKGKWELKILGQIASFAKGKSISKADIVEDGKFECIRYGELYTEYEEVITNIKSKTNLPLEDLVFSEKNDVIIPASGETQIDIATAACVTKDGVALGGDLNIIKTEKDGIFLSYYLNSEKKFDIARLAQGNAVVHIYNSQLKSLKLNFPTLPEQQKIASFLTAVDTKIQQLTQKKELLAKYKKEVIQQIFSGQLRFKDENRKEYPDWEEKRLDEITIFRRGKNIAASNQGTYYLLGMGAVSESGKLLVNKKTDYSDEFLMQNDLVMPERDIGVGLIIGRVARISGNNKYVLGANILSLTMDESCVSDYIYYQINDLRFRRKMKRLVNGSAQLMITSKEVKRLVVNLPCLAEQQKIANYLSAIDTKIESVAQQITQTQQFKKGLLQQMFV